MRNPTTFLRFAVGLLPLLSALACSDPASTGTGGGGAGTGGAGNGGGTPAKKTRIAFGSCVDTPQKLPALDRATESAPDLFIFMGDNVYGDTTDSTELQAKYDDLAAAPEFQALKAKAPIIATWDDHDYGLNDSGKEMPNKVESRQIFLDFWEEPADSPRRMHDGVYTSYLRQEAGGTVQIILLDARWFRDPLDTAKDPGYKNDYQPTTDTTRTILGAEQWAWLEEELKKPADVRIIGSSIQFSHEYNGWESWTNMPHEQQRMIDLIKKTGAENALFISGDVHWGELSKMVSPGVYPLYDLTSSGITEEWGLIEPNKNRVGGPVGANNYGFVEITWGQGGDHVLSLGLVDAMGEIKQQHEVHTTELRF